MKNILKTIVAIALLSISAFAGEVVNVAGASNVAVNGFDTVAFFTDSKLMSGLPSITAEHKGAIYFFATDGNKALFTANPEKYVPQFGGHCDYGVALNHLLPVQIPPTWQIRNGKLYFNLNPEIRIKFDADFEGNLAKANQNWPGLVKQFGK
jgi:hypothetical protein